MDDLGIVALFQPTKAVALFFFLQNKYSRLIIILPENDIIRLTRANNEHTKKVVGNNNNDSGNQNTREYPNVCVCARARWQGNVVVFDSTCPVAVPLCILLDIWQHSDAANEKKAIQIIWYLYILYGRCYDVTPSWKIIIAIMANKSAVRLTAHTATVTSTPRKYVSDRSTYYSVHRLCDDERSAPYKITKLSIFHENRMHSRIIPQSNQIENGERKKLRRFGNISRWIVHCIS